MVTLLFRLLQCGEKGHYANMVSQLINLPEKENKIKRQAMEVFRLVFHKQKSVRIWADLI